MSINKEKIRRKRHWGIYVIAFCLPIIGLLIHMIIGKCYPFGDNSILIGDARDQYLSFFTELYNRIKNGQSLLFSWNGGMGYDFYTTMMYYLMSPFNIIALCFGGYSMELGMIVTLAVETGACAVSALYYFRHTYINSLQHGRINDGITLVFSIAYAMCNYILAYQYNLMWLTSLVLVPILMLGIEKIVRKNDYRLYIVTLFFVFVVNFYFAWFVCILSFLWFVDQNRGGVKEWLKRFVKWLLVSVCAAVAASAILIPCYELVRTRNDGYTGISSYNWKTVGNIGSFIQSFFWGHDLDISGYSFFTYNMYCGIIVIILMLCYFFNADIALKQRLKRFVIIIFLVISLNVAGLIYIMHGFSYPHSVSNRNAAILAFFIIITGFEQINHLRKNGIWKSIAIIGLLLLGIGCAFIFNDNVQNLTCYFVTIIVTMYYIICFVLFERKSIGKKSLILNIAVLGFCEILSNSFFTNNKENVDIRVLQNIAVSQWSDEYESIKEDNGDRKTSWIFSTNDMTHSDTNLFSSMKNTDMVWLFQKLGLTYQVNGGCYIYRGTTPITAAMFNVRNVLTSSPAHYSGYSVLNSREIYSQYTATSCNLDLMENDYIAGLGFMGSDKLRTWNNSENVFEYQNDFIYRVTGKKKTIFSSADISDIDISGNYCLPLKQKENKFPYMSTAINDAVMDIELGFDVPENMHLYAYLSDVNHVMANFYIDGEEYSPLDSYPSSGETVDLGNLKKGQRVIMVIYTLASPGTKGEVSVDFYKCDDELAKACVEKIREHKLNITKFEDTCIEGNITASEDGIMYTSIPYYKGFKVYVDGKQTEITKIGNALIGVKLQKGKHDIRITYFPYGLKLGIILSVFGILCIILIVWINTRRLRMVQKGI